MERQIPVARVTRKVLEEKMSQGHQLTRAIIRELNLDVYDAIEGVVAINQPGGIEQLVTFSYQGREHTLPRYCVELISRYESD